LELDALIVSGGVSVGEHDLVKPALRALGAEIDLWRVAIKPGKPFLFGRAGSCAIFGLPERPKVCGGLRAEPSMCGPDRDHTHQ